MSLWLHVIRTILREHKYQPIRGDVCVIGRQTFHVIPDEMIALFKAYDIHVREADLDIDDYTQASLHARSIWVSDKSFFRAIGNERFNSVDVSSYERADIAHDLNTPIGDELANSFDFLVDGSTLDRVFNPSVALMSFARRSGTTRSAWHTLVRQLPQWVSNVRAQCR